MRRWLAFLLLLALPAWANEYRPPGGAGGLSVAGPGGGGTTNRVAKWTGLFTLGDSLLSDNGTNVTLTSGKFILPFVDTITPVITGPGTNSGTTVNGGDLFFIANGANRFLLSGGLAILDSAQTFGWSGTAPVNGLDLIMARDAAATLQLGNDTNTPVSQTVEAADALSGISNGSNLVLRGGLKSSTGQDGVVVIGRGYTVATLPTGTVVAGARAWVTDATTCTFNAAPTGAGALFCPVIYSGTAWLAG